MRLYSYIVVHDTGFAPNPFFGCCTLTCCEPTIRLAANVGDLIVGLAPKAQGNGVVYAMRVDEKLRFDQYWADERFQAKKPRAGTGQLVNFRGDNTYEPIGNDDFRQHRSMHWDWKTRKEDLQAKKTDLGGHFVLVGHEFHYFGSALPALPEHLESLICGRGYKNRFDPETIHAAEAWFSERPRGVLARPVDWDPNDSSWRETDRRSSGPTDSIRSTSMAPSRGCRW